MFGCSSIPFTKPAHYWLLDAASCNLEENHAGSRLPSDVKALRKMKFREVFVKSENEKEPYRYYPKEDIFILNMKVDSFDTKESRLALGPALTLNAPLEKVVKKIRSYTGENLECEENRCSFVKQRHYSRETILVAPSEEALGSTIVQCGMIVF